MSQEQLNICNEKITLSVCIYGVDWKKVLLVLAERAAKFNFKRAKVAILSPIFHAILVACVTTIFSFMLNSQSVKEQFTQLANI